MIPQLSQKHDEILGVGLTGTSIESLLRKITVDIRSGRKFYIVTPNPEIVMAAQKDKELLTALNASEVAIPDGVGLLAADKFLKMPVPRNSYIRLPITIFHGLIVGIAIIVNRDWLSKNLTLINGRKLFLDLIALANKNKWKVYFLGGESTEAEEAKKILERNYKSIKIKTSAGPILDISGTPKTSTDKAVEEEVVKDINNFSPDLLFVGISHPRQEKWLYRHYKSLNIKGAMTVGGTYKHVSGHYIHVPEFVSKLGLEWLWRLLTGGQKPGRVWTAIVKFPLKIFLLKLHGKISE